MPSKMCFKCERLLKLDKFYAHPQMADGHLNKCKTCNKRDSVRQYRKKWDDLDWRERQRARGRDKYNRLYRGKQHHQRNRAAHSAVARAVRDGRLIRPPACQECGTDGPTEGHHADYDKPLAVAWLCPPCHGLRHRRPF